MRWKARLMVGAAVPLMLLCWACAAGAGTTDRRYVWRNPCFQADSLQCDTISAVPETTLKEVRLWAVRFRDNDTLYLGPVPIGPRGCGWDSVLTTWLNGSMFETLWRTYDAAGHPSCGYYHYVDAIPADSTWDAVPLRPPGLIAQYWDNPDFTGDTIATTDSLVDFTCGSWPMAVAPIPSGTIGPGYFSVRWTGHVELPAAGTWTFCVDSDDGARLWVDGTATLDRWSATGRGKVCGSAALPAGTHDLKLEFRQSGGGCLVRLLWTPPGSPEQIVPSGALSH